MSCHMAHSWAFISRSSVLSECVHTRFWIAEQAAGVPGARITDDLKLCRSKCLRLKSFWGKDGRKTLQMGLISSFLPLPRGLLTFVDGAPIQEGVGAALPQLLKQPANHWLCRDSPYPVSSSDWLACRGGGEGQHQILPRQWAEGDWVSCLWRREEVKCGAFGVALPIWRF